MMKSVRSVALVAVGAFALSACGLGGLIPDQTVGGGVLGLGGGVPVVLTPGGVDAAAVHTSAVTTWVGALSATFTLDGLTDVNIPNLVSPDAIIETVELGDTIVVRNFQGPFTVTGLVLGGTFTVGTQTFNVPAGAGVTGLAVLFEDPNCVGDGAGDTLCTYTTAQNVPSVDVEFLASQVQAYWNLLRAGGGTVSVNLTVTVSLASPGMPADATITVILDSAGATIEF